MKIKEVYKATYRKHAVESEPLAIAEELRAEGVKAFAVDEGTAEIDDQVYDFMTWRCYFKKEGK